LTADDAQLSFLEVLVMLLAAALVLGLVGIAAFLWSRERPVMSRFLITVEVETPEGIRTGSSVVTAGYRGAGISSGGNRTVPRFSGEAVAIQLPGKPTLFALVGENESGYGMSQLIVSAFGGSNQFKAASIGEEVDLRRHAALGSGWPRFVRFRNANDVTSVERIDPDHLEVSYGPAYAIRRIAVRKTKDAETRQIARLLPSFSSESGFPAFYRSLPGGDPRRINRSDFERTF
jgi:hypothetical protein